MKRIHHNWMKATSTWDWRYVIYWNIWKYWDNILAPDKYLNKETIESLWFIQQWEEQDSKSDETNNHDWIDKAVEEIIDTPYTLGFMQATETYRKIILKHLPK